MPELVEVERYRQLAERMTGKRIRQVGASDAWYLKGGLTAEELEGRLVGQRVVAARRIGKLLLVDTTGPVLGLRFGMTGRLLLDGVQGIDNLIYRSREDRPEWDRFSLRLTGDSIMRMNDPRRLGGVLLDPDEGSLGVDALNATLADVRIALGSSKAPLKARLMDQARISGIGNLAVDELLWRAGMSPTRLTSSLTDAEVRRLARQVRSTMALLMRRGGSHTGDLQMHRVPGGRCPKDGTELRRATVGGRTTWWCPKHQV